MARDKVQFQKGIGEAQFGENARLGGTALQTVGGKGWYGLAIASVEAGDGRSG